MAVPLQPMSTFGSHASDWHNKLIFGDNLQTMKTLLQMKEAGELCNSDGTPGVRLVYIDPPFATKRDFHGTKDQQAYQDKVVGAEFIEFVRRRLILLRQLMAKESTIYLHIDSRKGHYIKAIMDEVFSGYEFAEIAWVCGLMGSGKFYPKAHENIYCYRSSSAPFNPPQRIGLSQRITKALKRDEDGWFYTRGKESSGGSDYLKSYIAPSEVKTKEEAIVFANKHRPQQAWSVWIGKKELALAFNDHATVSDTNIDKYDLEGGISYATQSMGNIAKQWLNLDVALRTKFQKLIFPSGIYYDRINSFGTPELGRIFTLYKEFEAQKPQILKTVDPTGLEPATPSLQMRCSTR